MPTTTSSKDRFPSRPSFSPLLSSPTLSLSTLTRLHDRSPQQPLLLPLPSPPLSPWGKQANNPWLPPPPSPDPYNSMAPTPPPPEAFITLDDVLQTPTAEMVVVKTYPTPQAAATTSPSRRLPMIIQKPEKVEKGARCAEMAGGMTAECAAVVCCCPCGLANLLVLAVVRLPAGLCRKALRKKRRKRMKNKLLASRPGSFDVDRDFGLPSIVPIVPESWPAKSPMVEVSEKEKEMWGQFYGAGFWRSPSQKE